MQTPECRNRDITITPEPRTVRVFLDGKEVASSNETLGLREGGYPIVYYFPNSVLAELMTEASDHQTYCPFKGYASYFHLRNDAGALERNAIWFYAEPCPLVAPIRDYVGFWGDKVRVAVDG